MKEGQYKGKLTKATVTESGKGSPQVVLDFDITQFWNNGEWRDAIAEPQRLYLSLHEHAIEHTERKLEFIGWNGDYEKPTFGDAARVDGVELRCTHEEFEGKPVERWELANVPRPELIPASAEQIERLQARRIARRAQQG